MLLGFVTLKQILKYDNVCQPEPKPHYFEYVYSKQTCAKSKTHYLMQVDELQRVRGI